MMGDNNLLTTLLVAAIVGLSSFFFAQQRKPGAQALQQQQQLMLLGVLAGGAYLLRQFEGRGDQQEKIAVTLAAMDAKNEERFTTVFRRLDTFEQNLNDHLPARRRSQRR